MTTQQLQDIFSKMHGGTNNVWVTYKKELPLSKTAKKNASINPADYYKVVTRLCRGDFDYYNGAQGKASLAAGNTKKLMPGTTGHVKDADGNDIEGLYTSPKGDRVRFFPSSGRYDDLRLFVKGQEVTLAEIQDLVNQDILSPDALKTMPSSDYMGPYVSTLINVVLRHKDGSEDIGDDSAIKYGKEYKESLNEGVMNIKDMPMMSENEDDLIVPTMREDMNESQADVDAYFDEREGEHDPYAKASRDPRYKEKRHKMRDENPDNEENLEKYVQSFLDSHSDGTKDYSFEDSFDDIDDADYNGFDDEFEDEFDDEDNNDEYDFDIDDEYTGVM